MTDAMKKKIVVCEFKDDGSYKTYRSCVELVETVSYERIGITVNSLWNALAKNGGVYENARCKIYYKDADKKIYWS